MNCAGIGIPEPAQTAPVNFETQDQCCEILNVSLLNREAPDLRAHETRVRKGSGEGRERRVDREETKMRYLKETVGKNSKRNL